MNLIFDADRGPRIGTLINKLAILAWITCDSGIPINRRQEVSFLEAHFQSIDNGEKRELAGIHLGGRIAQSRQMLGYAISLELKRRVFRQIRLRIGCTGLSSPLHVFA